MSINSFDPNKDSLYALVAAFAALAASIGDFLMLSVVHGAAWSTKTNEIANSIVCLGGLLGLVLIPLYFLGYAAATHLLDPLPSLTRKILLSAAAGTAVFGAIAHGLNAANIGQALVSGGPLPLPMEAIVPAWSPFFVVGSLASVGAVVASAAFCWSTWRFKRMHARMPALLNPIFGAAILLALGSPSRGLVDYLAFVGPNLAHSVFFLACRRAIARRRD